MRLVLQRVSQASVTISGECVAAIGSGVLVLVGIGHHDSDTDIQWAVKRILDTQLWPDEEDKPWKRSVRSSEREVLVVSQFTLYGQVYKKGKLDFHKALRPEPAQALYNNLMTALRSSYQTEKIKEGVFAAMMDVQLTNDGPVTILIESDEARDGEEKAST